MPREVHWRTAIRYGALVAAIGGVLAGLGTINGFVSFLSFLWVSERGSDRAGVLSEAETCCEDERAGGVPDWGGDRADDDGNSLAVALAHGGRGGPVRAAPDERCGRADW